MRKRKSCNEELEERNKDKIAEKEGKGMRSSEHLAWLHKSLLGLFNLHAQVSVFECAWKTEGIGWGFVSLRQWCTKTHKPGLPHSLIYAWMEAERKIEGLRRREGCRGSEMGTERGWRQTDGGEGWLGGLGGGRTRRKRVRGEICFWLIYLALQGHWLK